MDSKNERSEFKPVERHVKAHLAVLRQNEATGWKRMMTVTSWGGGKYKLDIRDWNREMTKSTKGITFTRSEAVKLRDILTIMDMNLIDDYADRYTYTEPNERNSTRPAAAPVQAAPPQNIQQPQPVSETQPVQELPSVQSGDEPPETQAAEPLMEAV